MTRWKWMPAVLAAGVLAFGAAACGDDDDNKGAGSTTASQSGDDGGAISAATQQLIDKAYKGTFTAPPSTSPRPRKDANIWFIPYSVEFQDWNQPGQIVDAAKAIGWKLTIFDGKYSPDTIVTGLRQAIADKADGIILGVVDCAPVKAGLQAVERAGIPVVAEEGFDCDEGKANQPSLFDAVVAYQDPENGEKPMGFKQFLDYWGYTQGLGVIAGTKGKAKLIDVRETDLATTIVGDDGMRRALKEQCPQCKIVETVTMVGSDVGEPLQQKVAQALARNPDANAVVSPYDAATVNIAAAVVASGRKDEIWVQGGEGLGPAIERLKKGNGVSAGVGLSVKWEFWAAMDALNRIFNGEKPGPDGFPTGAGVQLFDREHNLPEGKTWEPPIDFRSAYKKAWGVG